MTCPLRLLIVDDEAAIAEEISEYMAERGAHPIVANTAEAALAQLAGDPAITVALSDIRMPGHDGLSLLQLVLASRDEAQAVEVVMMTGHATLDDAITALQRKAFDFVRKPFSLAGLWQTLERAHASAMARRAEAAAAHLIEASERVGRDMMTVFNHEVRTSLVPIVGLADVIEHDAAHLSATELTEYGGLIRGAGERLSILTKLGQTLSGLGSGNWKPSLHPVSPETILAKVVKDHLEASASRGQVIELDCRIDRPVLTDQQMLVGALSLLTANAIRFSPNGSTVRLSATAFDGGVAFTVADQGGGMTAAQIDTALQPFRHLDTNPHAEHRVLNLADQMIQAIGGRLHLDSVVGRGTVARLELPGHTAE